MVVVVAVLGVQVHVAVYGETSVVAMAAHPGTGVLEPTSQNVIVPGMLPVAVKVSGVPYVALGTLRLGIWFVVAAMVKRPG
jgi:hypothetical protein